MIANTSTLLATDPGHAVRVQLHRDHEGRQSTHVFDVYRLDETEHTPR
jgi:hypothetical protein